MNPVSQRRRWGLRGSVTVKKCGVSSEPMLHSLLEHTGMGRGHSPTWQQRPGPVTGPSLRVHHLLDPIGLENPREAPHGPSQLEYFWSLLLPKMGSDLQAFTGRGKGE